MSFTAVRCGDCQGVFLLGVKTCPSGGASWKNEFVLPIGAQGVTTWLGSAAELALLVRFWGPPPTPTMW
jgi:hypothetical protein